MSTRNSMATLSEELAATMTKTLLCLVRKHSNLGVGIDVTPMGQPRFTCAGLAWRIEWKPLNNKDGFRSVFLCKPMDEMTAPSAGRETSCQGGKSQKLNHTHTQIKNWTQRPRMGKNKATQARDYPGQVEEHKCFLPHTLRCVVSGFLHAMLSSYTQ